jgi:hypothetical protein
VAGLRGVEPDASRGRRTDVDAHGLRVPQRPPRVEDVEVLSPRPTGPLAPSKPTILLCSLNVAHAVARIPRLPMAVPIRLRAIRPACRTGKGAPLRATRERRTSRRMLSIPATIGLVTAMAALTLLLAPAALSVPKGPNVTVVQQACDGGTWVTYLHPGTGKALWDVTTEVVTNGPNALIKAIDQEIFVNGESIGVFSFRFGNKTGLGDSFTCTYVESFTAPNGDAIEVHGTSYKVPTHVPS